MAVTIVSHHIWQMDDSKKIQHGLYLIEQMYMLQIDSSL